MIDEKSHRAMRDLLGAHALNAVDPEESILLEEHLEECGRCRSELSGLLETAAEFAPPAALPDGLWERLEESLEAHRPPAFGAPGIDAGREQTIWRRVAVGIAVAATVVIAAMGAQIARQDRRLTHLAGVVSGRSLESSARAAMSHPQAKSVALKDPDDPRTAVQLVLLPDGIGFVVSDSLRALPAGTYQLWILTGDKKISAGVLGPDPGIFSFKAAGPVDGFAVTREPSPSVSPTSDPVVVGFVADA